MSAAIETENQDDGILAQTGDFLKRAGKAVLRGIGNTAGYLGTMTAIGVTLAYGIAVVVPAFFGLVGGAGVLEVLGMAGAALIPFGGVVLGGIAAATAGYFLAEAAGGSAFAENEPGSPARSFRRDNEITRPSASPLKTLRARSSFNDESPRPAEVSGFSPAIAAAISAATFSV